MLAGPSSRDAFSTCLATEACSASAPLPRGGNKAASSWLCRGPEFSQNSRPAACSSTSASCSWGQSGAAHALWKAAGKPCGVSSISCTEHGGDTLTGQSWAMAGLKVAFVAHAWRLELIEIQDPHTQHST